MKIIFQWDGKLYHWSYEEELDEEIDEETMIMDRMMKAMDSDQSDNIIRRSQRIAAKRRMRDVEPTL